MTIVFEHVEKVLLGAAVTLVGVCAYQNVYRPLLNGERGRQTQ
jgi:hypothetical protein